MLLKYPAILQVALGDQPLQLAGGRVQCGLRQSVDGRKLKFFIENQDARVGILVLVEKAVQRIALPQEVEPRLRDTQYERLPSQLTETQHIARGGIRAIILPALVKGCDLFVLAETGFLAGSCPPLQGDDQRFRRIRKAGSNSVTDTVQ